MSAIAPECRADRLALATCSVDLARATAARPALDLDFAATSEDESPEAWTAALEDTLERCPVGAELEIVDCSSYPCVAALRPEPGRTSQALSDALEGCDPAAFEETLLLNVEVDCPGGGREVMTAAVRFDLEDLDARVRTADNEGQDGLLIAHMGRRVASLPGLWACEGPPDGGDLGGADDGAIDGGAAP